MPRRTLDRRTFLGQASCATVGSLGLLSTLVNLRLAGSAAAQSLPAPGEDFRALVCLFLAGGIDSYNLLVPAEGDAHARYVTVRGGTNPDAGGLALDASSLLLLPASSHAGTRLGLHPSLADYGATPGMRSLFDQGHLAFVSNIGTLVDRVTKAQYGTSTARVPRGLYSHSDQQQQWHTSVPDSVSPQGWIGRAADLLHAGNTDARVSMNLSISGNNLWQTGRRVVAYSFGTGGAVLPSDYNPITATPVLGTTSRGAARTAGHDNLLAQEYANLLERTFAANLRDSIDAAAYFSSAFNAATLTTPFPGDSSYTPPAGFTNSNDPARTLGQQMKAVVRALIARGPLGLRRQTFFVNYGGWDHHDEVIDNMTRMLDVVNRCVASFWQALVETGLSEHVVLYSASDFGRTLTSNGNGSDHAWGGNMFVLGGPVLGGKVYGAYPDLALDGPQVVTRRGATIPGWSVDEMFAELALWLGVTPGDLPAVLPRIHAFMTPGGAPPIGFLRPA